MNAGAKHYKVVNINGTVVATVSCMDTIEQLCHIWALVTPDVQRAINTPGWWLYLIDCQKDNHFYVGITSRLADRIYAHSRGQGSVPTKAYGVKRVTPIEVFQTRPLAEKAETALSRELRQAGCYCTGGGFHYELCGVHAALVGGAKCPPTSFGRVPGVLYVPVEGPAFVVRAGS